jgi:hypothetical protein
MDRSSFRAPDLILTGLLLSHVASVRTADVRG